MKSGSRKGARARAVPPELTAWQARILGGLAASSLAKDATFGGATALSLLHLHHRRSEDLDFFLSRAPTPADAAAVRKAAAGLGVDFETEQLPTRCSIVLTSKGKAVGHVDLAHFPYEPVDAPTRWQGLRVDSIRDMAVNKVQAVLTRGRDRDFVDLYFLLREGPERDVGRLLLLARAKFEAGPNPIALAERLLLAEEIQVLPEMLRPVALPELQSFFAELSRSIVRRDPR